MKSLKSSPRSSRPAHKAVRGHSSTATAPRRSAPKAVVAAPAVNGTKANGSGTKSVAGSPKKTATTATSKPWYKGKQGKAAAAVGAAAVLVGVGALVRKFRSAR